MTETATSAGIGAGLTRRGRTIALWVVLLAFFMDLLDTTIVNVAIPSIQTGLAPAIRRSSGSSPVTR